jgi:hypothetical protein
MFTFISPMYFILFYCQLGPDIHYTSTGLISGSHGGDYMMTAFWDVAMVTLMVEAVRISETSVYFYETTWHNVPEGCHFHLQGWLPGF